MASFRPFVLNMPRHFCWSSDPSASALNAWVCFTLICWRCMELWGFDVGVEDLVYEIPYVLQTDRIIVIIDL